LNARDGQWGCPEPQTEKTDDGDSRKDDKSSSNPDFLNDPGSEQELNEKGEAVDSEIDSAKKGGSCHPVVDEAVNNVRLLEIKSRRCKTVEKEINTYANQKRGIHHQTNPVKDLFECYGFSFFRVLCFISFFSPAFFRIDSAGEKNRQFKKNKADEDEVKTPDVVNQKCGNSGADKSTQTPAHCDEAVKTLGSSQGEDIGHEPPEYGDDKQIEYADPDIEYAAQPDLTVCIQPKCQYIKSQQVKCEEMINNGNEYASGETGDQSSENGRGQDHSTQSAKVEIGQIMHSAGHTHLLTKRTEDVVRAQNTEEITEREKSTLPFLGLRM